LLYSDNIIQSFSLWLHFVQAKEWSWHCLYKHVMMLEQNKLQQIMKWKHKVAHKSLQIYLRLSSQLTWFAIKSTDFGNINDTRIFDLPKNSWFTVLRIHRSTILLNGWSADALIYRSNVSLIYSCTSTSMYCSTVMTYVSIELSI